MGTLAFIGLCIGAAVGFQFKVFALFPLTLLVLIMVTARGLAIGQTLSSILLMDVVVATCLQFGFTGAALLDFLGGSKAESPQPARPVAQ